VGKFTDYSMQTKIDFQREDKEKKNAIMNSRIQEKQRRHEDQ